MSKHVFDNTHTNTGKRLQKYVSIERDQSGAHLQTLKLPQRKRSEPYDNRRIAEYMRIDRGVTA